MSWMQMLLHPFLVSPVKETPSSLRETYVSSIKVPPTKSSNSRGEQEHNSERDWDHQMEFVVKSCHILLG
jgi:hypothetical protein